jgi:hypothetical protein
MVRNIGLRTGDGDAKKTFLTNPFCSDCIIRFSIENDLDRTRVRPKDPDLDIITDLMRT